MYSFIKGHHAVATSVLKCGGHRTLTIYANYDIDTKVLEISSMDLLTLKNSVKEFFYIN